MRDAKAASWRSAAVLLMMSAACVRSSSSSSPPPTTTPTTDTVDVEPLRCVDAAADRSVPQPPPVFGYYPAPIHDSDDDGYDDPIDECPNYPEDYDAFEDGDGCPDCDNDGDGVRDADVLNADRMWVSLDHLGNEDCRNDREDFDGDRDEDGCSDVEDEP